MLARRSSSPDRDGRVPIHLCSTRTGFSYACETSRGPSPDANTAVQGAIVTEDGAGTIDPTATGERVKDVPILKRDETDTCGTITMGTSDVTAWCPYEGTADYYDVEITYRPDEYVVELMSLRDYFGHYRDEAISHEDFAQRVFDHLLALLDPVWLRLVVEAPPRYGIETTIVHDTSEDTTLDASDGDDEDERGEGDTRERG